MKWFFKCFRQYADFDGRARRKEFWWFTLINFVIMFALTIGWTAPIFNMAVDSGDVPSPDETELLLVMAKSPCLYILFIYYLAILIPSIAVTVRRLHDMGRSGYWAFFVYSTSICSALGSSFQATNAILYTSITLISLVITIISLVWLFTNSNYGPNKWGLNPKGEGNPTDEDTIITKTCN